ncbi:hypothetical protein GGI20_000814 [Coemansia sp. BCRC 34301]|nr:hypothetical protein GGI20_000814 [Coemansia sp. BCRC 34301]
MSTAAGVGDEDEDEMENEFGGAGTYNQELQSVFQEMLTHILGRPITAATSVQGSGETDDEEGNNHSAGAGHRRRDAGADNSDAAHDEQQRLPDGIRTWTSNLDNGGTVSVSVGNYATGERPGAGSGEHPRRPMFIDPEENAPISLGNFMSSLLGALGGNLRGVGGGAGEGGVGPIFGMPIGNLGDYAWGQNSLDDIITQIMEQNQGVHAPPPASQEAILKLPKRLVTSEELQRNLDCGICMEEYKPEEYAVELPCKHMYHKDCIDHWLGMNGTCPICRAAVEARPEGPSATAPRPSRTHTEMPGSYPSSPAVATTSQTVPHQQEAAGQHPDSPPVPEPEPMD